MCNACMQMHLDPNCSLHTYLPAWAVISFQATFSVAKHSLFAWTSSEEAYPGNYRSAGYEISKPQVKAMFLDSVCGLRIRSSSVFV